MSSVVKSELTKPPSERDSRSIRLFRTHTRAKVQLWVSQEKRKRFDVHDAKTGRKLWSYSSTDTNSGEFNCYPSWENGGKTLATIENDTLLVRDAANGKIALFHKNKLPAPLVSSVFTKDGDTVYLMDARGKIFRQRLR